MGKATLGESRRQPVDLNSAIGFTSRLALVLGADDIHRVPRGDEYLRLSLYPRLAERVVGVHDHAMSGAGSRVWGLVHPRSFSVRRGIFPCLGRSHVIVRTDPPGLHPHN